jgi:hypothetical protein
MTRESLHVEPQGALQIARHYVRELIYGANDGIITTFAVVARGGLSLRVVLIIGAANLFADGLSMAVGNYLSIRSHESVRETQELPEEEASPFRHACATFLAFVLAGAVPLVPYMVPISLDRFASSIAFTPSRNVRRRCVARADCQRPMVEGQVVRCWVSVPLWRRSPTAAVRS